MKKVDICEEMGGWEKKEEKNLKNKQEKKRKQRVIRGWVLGKGIKKKKK